MAKIKWQRPGKARVQTLFKTYLVLLGEHPGQEGQEREFTEIEHVSGREVKDTYIKYPG